MDCLDGVKFLFEQTDDQANLIEMQKQMAEKLKLKNEQQKEKLLVDERNRFFFMQNHQSKRICQKATERYEYGVQVKGRLMQILGQTLTISVLLKYAEFDKIKKYDELPYEQFNDMVERQKLVFQDMAEQMESRPMMKRVRTMQQKVQEVLEMRKSLDETVADRRLNYEKQMESAVQERNQLIVGSIQKSKELAESRLKREEELKNPKFEQKVEILSAISLLPPKVIAAKTTSPQPVAAIDPPKSDKQISKVPLMPARRKTKLSSKEIESIINKKFDFDALLKKPKTTATAAPSTLRSILRKPNVQQQQNRLKKHVVVVSPSPSLSSFDSRDEHQNYGPMQKEITSLDMETESSPSSKIQGDTATKPAEEQAAVKGENEQQKFKNDGNEAIGIIPDTSAESQQKQQIQAQQMEIETQDQTDDHLNSTYTIAESLLATNSTVNALSSSHNDQPSTRKTPRHLALRLSSDSDSSVELEKQKLQTKTVKAAKLPNLLFDSSDSDIDTDIDSPRQNKAKKNGSFANAFKNQPMFDLDFDAGTQQASNDDFFAEFNAGNRGFSSKKCDEDFL